MVSNISNAIDQVRTNLLIKRDMPDVSDVYMLLLQEESHRDLSKDPNTHETAAVGVE